MNINGQEIDPKEYFDNLKKIKKKTDNEFLKNLYDNSEILLQKAFAINQDAAIKKLIFIIECLQKEYRLLEMNIDTFLYRDDIEFYINMVKDKAIKVIELRNYPREIPDEITDTIIKLKEENIFDEYYIVFTDYTGEVERQVKEENKRKDPILFGSFVRDKMLHDRFYYIADWEDQYCDLTLSKMISEMATQNKQIENKINVKSASLDEIKEYLTQLEIKQNNRFVINPKQKKTIFSKVKTWLTKK